MKKMKYLITIFVFILLISITTSVNAADKITTTSTLNGIEVTWEYELNESNEVINLVCKNATDLSGSVTIPDKIDGKNVISIGDSAFKSATNITEVIISKNIKEIELWAFSGCTSLSNVDLGNVEEINDYSFGDCISLESIKIPKTLNKGASGKPFANCINLKTIELEEGMTIIPDYLCAGTPIEEIKIPSTVKEIGLWAFSECTNLSKVDLGNVEQITEGSFKDCTSLESIKIPKTLNKRASGRPFWGCINLKTIELEEGMTLISDYLCAGTPIEEITIPSTVEEIGIAAFSECDKLTEVSVPSNVTKISVYAFKDCSNLTKITILDNVTYIGWSDLVFDNHNEDLTIYCYEESFAAEYAIKNNIKYVYLKRESSTPSTTEKNSNEIVVNTNTNSNNTNNTNNTSSNTNKVNNNTSNNTAKGSLPYTGLGVGMGIFVILVMAIEVVAYFKYNKLRDIE